MGNYTTIGSAIKTILDGITEFNVVYNYEPKELLKYPAGTVTAQAHNNEFASTRSNVRVYTFNIRLYFRTDTAEDAEGILRGLTDKVIEAIEADVTLSGACDYAFPISADWSFVEREVPLRAVSITINASQRDPR